MTEPHTGTQPASPLRRAYLLRCWRETTLVSANEPPAWRFSLREVAESPHEHVFVDRQALIDFIMRALG